MTTEKILSLFCELSAIPRRSGNERAVCEWLCNFAEKRGLEYYSDALYNVVIKKPASAGVAADPVILQGHTDMVCASAPGCTRPPEIYGVTPIREGDILRADGTTLGADNGVAVAMMLAALDSDTLRHPPLECVFTTQEETGLSGAAGLDASWLSGRTMINLDSEEDGVATVSCAGGKRMRFFRDLVYDSIRGSGVVINIDGLKGGHSGMEIGSERINAIKLASDLLRARDGEGYLCDIWGGEADNAIPRKSSVTIAYRDEAQRAAEVVKLKAWCEKTKEELRASEPDLTFEFVMLDDEMFMTIEDLTADLFERMLTLVPNGVRSRNPDAGGFVVSSQNLGVVGVDGKHIYAVFSLRSSEERMMRIMTEELNTLADTLLFECTSGSEYPGWAYAPESRLRDVMSEAHRDLFGSELRIEAIHAGLECGIFAEKLPGLDAVAIGPTVTGCHTPEEKLSISSLERVAKLVAATLDKLAG